MKKPPIPVPDPDVEALTFRCKFLHPWFIITCGALALGIPATLSLAPTENPMLISSGIAFGTILAIIFCAIYTVLLIVIFPIKIDATLLRGQNIWSKATHVEWSHVTSTQRTRFATLPYLKISTSSQKNLIWLPLFLSNLQGFREAVANFTPPDHPLRLALEKEFPE